MNKRKHTWRVSVLTVFAAAAAFAAALNLSSGFADAAAKLPGAGSLVRAVTLGRYEVSDGGYSAKVVTPKIEGLLNKELEDKLNAEFADNSAAVIAAFEGDVRQLCEEYGDDAIHMGVESDYTVKTDNEDILALDVYLMNVAGSSSTKHTFYNIDKRSGALLELKDLFDEGVDYITLISEYVSGEMKRRNDEENGMFWHEGNEGGFEYFDEIKANQSFYINEGGDLVICFDKYDVAAGAQGSPEFVIPRDVTGG